MKSLPGAVYGFRAWCTAWALWLFLLLVSPFALAAPIDLAHLSPDEDLAAQMQMLESEMDVPAGVQNATGWVPAASSPERLAAPREWDTLWLSAELVNSSPIEITRWLEVTPWRLNQLDAWLLNPATGRVIEYIASGLDVPVEERRVESRYLLLPISLEAGESARLLLRVHSDSRPFLRIHSWQPMAFVADEVNRYRFHSLLLAVILTLVVVLLLQHNVRYALVGLWMLALFVLEAEKEGYISHVLLEGLEDFANHLRFSSAVAAHMLFMCVSVYLLGLEKERGWRWLLPVSVLTAVVYGALTFVFDGVAARQLLLVLTVSWTLIWPFMLPAARRQERPYQTLLTVLLAVGWLNTAWHLFIYLFNIDYSAEFTSLNLQINVAVVLGVLLTYARQKRRHEQQLEQQLRESEKAERERLEQAVAARTHELSEALTAARKADDARTHFLRQVTHDLRSPLTSILGYAQLLRSEEGKVGRFSAIIHDSATHMLNLVNRLIDYARDATQAEVTPEPVYLYAFMRSIGHEARILAGRQGNAFRLEFEPGLPPVVQCDETFLREVLLNLVDNASKHTVDGEITLRVARADGQGDHQQIVYELSDTGTGIAPHEQERLFDPFYRASGQGDGVGLGLPIVKELVAKMKGSITLQSQPGEGTQITVALPLVQGEEDADQALQRLPARLLPQLNAGGRYAWVIEDVKAIRDLLMMELGALGFVVDGYASAEDAMAALRRPAARRPSLMLTDHQLTGSSGDAVLELAQQQVPPIPVILLSATWHLQGPEKATASRYAARLSKPVDLVLLRREVARACGLPLQAASINDGESPAAAAASLEGGTLASMNRWLDEGAVSDIVEWCDQLLQNRPELSSFAREIRDLAERGDFMSIRARLNGRLG